MRIFIGLRYNAHLMETDPSQPKKPKLYWKPSEQPEETAPQVPGYEPRPVSPDDKTRPTPVYQPLPLEDPYPTQEPYPYDGNVESELPQAQVYYPASSYPPAQPAAPVPPAYTPIPPRNTSQDQANYNRILGPKRRSRAGCCGCLAPAALLLALIALVYLLFPLRTNILMMGIDARPDEGVYGRSDTTILMTVNPLKPYIGTLSIPRDLWVQIPGHGENRINTAHFFGEIDQPGSGPQAAMQAIRQDFGVTVNYYVRIQFEGFRHIVDALGGVDVTLTEPMSGYDPGTYHLNGEKALALVRDRETSDDFSRMQRGMIFIKAMWKQMIRPTTWPRLPETVRAASKVVDTNVPVWMWPRLGVALLRLGPDGIDSRSIGRDMVTPFVTSEGAQVLAPDWDKINPVLMAMFGQ